MFISDVEKHQSSCLSLVSGLGCFISCLHSLGNTFLNELYNCDGDRQRDILKIKHIFAIISFRIPYL